MPSLSWVRKWCWLYRSSLSFIFLLNSGQSSGLIMRQPQEVWVVIVTRHIFAAGLSAVLVLPAFRRVKVISISTGARIRE